MNKNHPKDSIVMFGMQYFQWLVVDRKALLKEKIEYDAKTNIWIPDPKDGYVKATIVSTKGDDVTVKNDNNMQVRAGCN